MSNKAFLSFFAVLSLIAFGSGYWMESQALKKVRRVIEEPPFVKEGLLAYYPLDSNVDGNASDATGNGYVGKMEGPPKMVEDRFGKKRALLFEGSFDYVNFDKNKKLRIPDPNQCSVSFWLKTNDSSKGTVMQLFGDELEEEGGQPPVTGYLGIGNGGKTIFLQWFSRTVGDNLEGELDASGDGWNHVVVSFTTESQEGRLSVVIYLNGQKVPHHSNPMKTSLFEEPIKMKKVFILGRQSKVATEFRGVLDDVRIYSRSLSELEIKNLYEYEKYRE